MSYTEKAGRYRALQFVEYCFQLAFIKYIRINTTSSWRSLYNLGNNRQLEAWKLSNTLIRDLKADLLCVCAEHIVLISARTLQTHLKTIEQI